ncbi:hypothetical protein KI387_014410, partial [Taxus chinensis]
MIVTYLMFFFGLSKDYSDSPTPSHQGSPIDSAEEENVDDAVGIENENVVGDVVRDTIGDVVGDMLEIVDIMEVSEEIDVEDTTDVAATVDVDTGTAEILLSVLEKINRAFTIIKSWKDHTNKDLGTSSEWL